MAIYQVLRQVLRRTLRGSVPILLGAMVLVILVESVVVYFAERGINSDFQNWGDCLWWIVVTISTVGYGDKIPITLVGRSMAFIAMLVGPVVLVSFVGSLGTVFYDEWQKGAKGMSQITSKGHILICGWNAAAIDIISELRQSSNFKRTPITIVDDTIDTNPRKDSGISFVYGNPSDMKTLEQANTREASYAIILAKNQTGIADQQTVLTVLAIEAINPEIHTCAEVNDPANECHVRRAGCDVIVNTNMLTSKLLALSLENPAANRVITQLASFRGSEIYRVRIPQEAEGHRFDDTLSNYKKGCDVIIIGIERGNEILINPSGDVQLIRDDHLLVISEHAPILETGSRISD